MCCCIVVVGWIGIVFSFFFFKQKTAYEMRISDWSSDVCSSDLHQKADGAAVHAKDRQTTPLVEQLVQHVEQETVAAERDQQVGLGQVDEVVKRAQLDRKSVV